MISVQEADKIIFSAVKELPSVRIPLSEAYGRVLHEDITADRDVPPFHRATMDGIAINFSSWEKGERVFVVQGVQKAGSPPLTLGKDNECFEVMTGAVVPSGCDCVIPIEHIEVTDGTAKINEDYAAARMRHIHAKAADYKSGQLLVLRGSRLLPPHVAVAASMGKTEVLVAAMPKIAVIGTGDELVGIHQEPESYQIRQSNSYALQAALTLNGYPDVVRYHITDDLDELKSRLQEFLEQYDVIVLSGGVSAGKFDFVPEALKSAGVEVLFHQVKQRPGKPFWFGKGPNDQPVFALPGNPVSTQVGLTRYVLPYLNRALKANVADEEYAMLDEDVEMATPFTYFLPVRMNHEGQYSFIVRPVFSNGSGDFVSLAKSDGFLEIPEGTTNFVKRTLARFYRWV